VVDDDVRNIFALTVLLERGGLEVVSAETGADAIATLEQATDIDLVLMDIMMPVMDGYATMRAIRELPELGGITIIALTAKTGAGERDRCLNAGASGYISKPVENGPDFIVAMSECLMAAESMV
jgi:CheY-like chemotaxis protein